MKAVIQRVLQASVTVADRVVGQIGPGMLVLAAVEAADTDAELEWVAAKLVGLRIFRNADKHFDLDIQQVQGSILLVSNFTVAAETAKGRRPSLSNAAPPDAARVMFEKFIAAVRRHHVPVQPGDFASA